MGFIHAKTDPIRFDESFSNLLKEKVTCDFLESIIATKRKKETTLEADEVVC